MDQVHIDPPIGIIGLGIMGGLIARELIAAGHAVLAYDINPQVLHAFKCSGGLTAPDAPTVASQSNTVLLSLPSAAACHAVAAQIAPVCAESLVEKLVVETSTLSIIVNPGFPSDFQSYAQTQAEILVKAKKIDKVPDWKVALRPDFMAKAMKG